MKLTVPLIVGALLSAGAFAQEPGTRMTKEMFEKQAGQLCDMAEKMAETAMRVRQAGVPLSETRKDFQANLPAADGFGGVIRDALENILLNAYEMPRQPTELLQRQAVENYRDSAYLECVRTSKDAWIKSQKP